MRHQAKPPGVIHPMAKLTASQKARAKAMSARRGVKYPNAWSNLAVARGKAKKSSTKKAKT